MKLKGVLKNDSPWAQLFIFLGAALIGAFIFSALGMLIVAIQMAATTGIDANFAQVMMEHAPYMRELQFFSAIGIFVLPAITCAYLYSDNLKTYLFLDKPGHIRPYILTVLCTLALIPLSNFTYSLNMLLDLPDSLQWLEDWMKAMEEANGSSIEKMLYAENTWALVMNIVIIGILPAVGEELTFRAVGQNIMGRIVKNHHIVIWVVAIIFSAVHLQFYGFLPRLLLGAYMGYLLYFSKNIWLPILAHFSNNTFSVIMYYIHQDSVEEMEQMDAIGWGDTWWMAVASLAIVLFLMHRIKSSNNG